MLPVGFAEVVVVAPRIALKGPRAEAEASTLSVREPASPTPAKVTGALVALTSPPLPGVVTQAPNARISASCTRAPGLGTVIAARSRTARIVCQLVPELFMRSILMLAFASLAWLPPTQVDACGATPPSFTLLTDAMGRVPAGTKVLKLYVYGSSIQPTPPKVVVSSGAGGLSVTVPVTLRVSAPWLLEVDLGNAAVQAGVSYSLSVAGVESEAGNERYSAQLPFIGAAASPIPAELGRLALDKRASGKMTVGGCGHSDEGEHVLIRLVASAAAEPWLRALKHQLLVDGAPAFESEIPLVDHVARPSETVIRAIAHCDRATSAGEIPYERGIEFSL
jgi:hypothetical protein